MFVHVQHNGGDEAWKHVKSGDRVACRTEWNHKKGKWLAADVTFDQTELDEREEKDEAKIVKSWECCTCCGHLNHSAEECAWKKEYCQNCGAQGHLANMCEAPGMPIDEQGYVDENTQQQGRAAAASAAGDEHQQTQQWWFRNEEAITAAVALKIINSEGKASRIICVIELKRMCWRRLEIQREEAGDASKARI